MVGQDRVTPRTLYLYLVCLSMLLVGLFAAVQLARSALDLALPAEVPPSFGWTAYTPLDVLSEEQYEELGSVTAEDAQRREATREAVVAGTTLLLAGGLYAYHWRRAQAERTVPATQVAPAAGPPHG